MSGSPTIRRAVALAAVAALSTGCLPDAVTRQGDMVAGLYNLFLIASTGIFAVVVGLLMWSIVRHRGRPGRDVPLPPQTRGGLVLEITWWTLPSLLVLLLAVLTISVLGQVDARSEDPLVVEVEGFQWGWRFTYPDSGVVVSGTAADPPTIVLPLRRAIAFEITARDVVHSFNIPAFLIKRDAIPNRPNRFDVEIEIEGTYTGQCGEFCGLLHARQFFVIEAVQPDAFDAWVAEHAEQVPEARP